MNMINPHPEETHRSHRAAWLRAAVLGVDDGIVSTSSIMIGVMAARASDATILTAGISALAAGALSMAVGEYVSVSSQKDSEKEDIAIETRSLQKNHDLELQELAHIYQQRGLTPKLALEVAKQLHAHDAVGAHVRDELGIDHEALANPLQAALASAGAFSVGALVPVLAALVATQAASAQTIVIASLAMLGIFGAIGAFIGGGNKLKAALRVFVGGGLAMAITALVGHLVGLNV
jgi:VIT1/CCC1 family predicted Fe2+/Mn2+ transporter